MSSCRCMLALCLLSSISCIMRMSTRDLLQISSIGVLATCMHICYSISDGALAWYLLQAQFISVWGVVLKPITTHGFGQFGTFF